MSSTLWNGIRIHKSIDHVRAFGCGLLLVRRLD